MPENDSNQPQDFMDGYGVAEERRAKLIKWIAIGTVVAAVVGTSLFFYLRTYSEKQIIAEFLDAVESQDLERAYAMWCPSNRPCPYYPLEKFTDDFGTGGSYPWIADAELRYVDYCGAGVVFSFQYPGATDNPVLWVQRDDGIISFFSEIRCPGRHLNFGAFWDRFFGPTPAPPAPATP